MSTSSATNSSSTKAARNASYEALVDGLEAWEKSELVIFLMKEVNKNITKTGRARRSPKLDDDGNIVKRELNPGARAWNEFVGHIKSQLQEAYPEEKISHKACLRLGSILKDKAEADEENNTFYPIDNLSHEVLMEEWEAWNSLPDEEKFPAKEPKAKKGKKAAAETDAEEEAPKEKKPRGRPSKKTVASMEDSEAEEAPKPKAKKTAAVSDSEAETVSSKKSKAKAKAVVEDSEAEEEAKAVAKKAVKAKAKAVVEDSEAEAEPKAVAKKAAKKTKGE